MRNKGWNGGYFLREGFVSIFKHGVNSTAAVCMIVVCLLIMGTFSLVAVNLDANLKELEAENEFLAYVDESLSEAAARKLEDDIMAVPNVRSAEFVSRVEVRDKYIEEHQGGLFEGLPDDTFRHRFRIHVGEIQTMEETVEAVRRLRGIGDVSAGLEIAAGMVAVRNVATGVALVLITALAIMSIFIIANTIRLATFYRREEIAIMKMCGATNGFIRWPFVVEGGILGVGGAVIAFFLQWGLYHFILKALQSSGRLGFLVTLPFAGLWSTLLMVFVGAGLIIGILGSLISIRKFLQV